MISKRRSTIECSVTEGTYFLVNEEERKCVLFDRQVTNRVV